MRALRFGALLLLALQLPAMADDPLELGREVDAQTLQTLIREITESNRLMDRGEVEESIAAQKSFVEAARARGYVFVGFGVFLDVERIESLLTRKERDLLRHAPEHPREAVTLLLQKLYGDYVNLKEPLFPDEARLASSFFAGQSRRRGVCRHKAVILAALLDHYGIRARLRLGWTKFRPDTPRPTHIWVILPELGWVADPTSVGREPIPALIYNSRTVHAFVDHGETIVLDDEN